MLSDWGVDFIKVDGCNVDRSEMIAGYTAFGEAMNKTGRQIMLVSNRIFVSFLTFLQLITQVLMFMASVL